MKNVGNNPSKLQLQFHEKCRKDIRQNYNLISREKYQKNPSNNNFNFTKKISEKSVKITPSISRKIYIKIRQNYTLKFHEKKS